MTRTFGEEGSLGDLPWASVFDPAANSRALSAIQAEGFRAASQIVDRFVRLAPTDGEAATTEPRPGAPDLEQLTRAWWSVAGQFLLGGGRARDAELDLSSPEGQQVVVLESATPGRGATVVWVHNRTDRDFGRMQLRCSELLARSGAVISSREVTFDPAVVEMPPRCSRGIAVALQVSDSTLPGVYRGTMLVDADDSLWLPVVLTVRAPES